MSRLYIRIWVAVLGCGLVGLLAGWWVSDAIDALNRVPPVDSAAVLAPDGSPVDAATGAALLADAPGPLEPTISGRHGISTWLPIGLMMLGMGALSYPVVRRLTRRLETLRDRVRLLGEGDLDARVQVDGHDEISELARSFNRAAQRIAELLRANRSLLANSSHELRSPLARMRLALALLEDSHPQVQGDRTFVEIGRSLNEMEQIIEELLTSSQLQSTARINRAEQPVALGAIVAQEIRHLAPGIAGTVSCGVASAGAGGTSMAGAGGINEPDLAACIDPVLFRRLVRNLVENAVKYGEGQPITVSLSRVGAWIEIRVADLGPGIPLDERERIFEPFYRRSGAAEAKGGVGLGLALVRQIAELHGGRAWCEANLPSGSVFICRLQDEPVGQSGWASAS